MTEACRELGVQFLTLYAFSSENWKRPKREVDALMKLLELYLKRETADDDEEQHQAAGHRPLARPAGELPARAAPRHRDHGQQHRS